MATPSWALILFIFASLSALLTVVIWVLGSKSKKPPLWKAGLVLVADIVLMVALVAFVLTGQDKVVEEWWSGRASVAAEASTPNVPFVDHSQPDPLTTTPDIGLAKVGLIVLVFGLAAVMMFFALKRDPGAGPLMRYAAPAGVVAIAALLVFMQVKKEQRFRAESQLAEARANEARLAADAAFVRLTEPRIELETKEGAAAREDADAPEWVTNPPCEIGETSRLVLFAEGVTPWACREDAEQKLRAAAELIARGDHAALKRVGGPRGYGEPGLGSGLAIPALRQRLVKSEHLDEGVLSSGVHGKTRAMLVEISPDDAAWLQSERREIEQQRAMSTALVISGGVLGALAVSYAVLNRGGAGTPKPEELAHEGVA